MSELRQLRCDSCGKLGEEQSVVGWFRVERTGIHVGTYGEQPGPWDFDTPECFLEWLAPQMSGTVYLAAKQSPSGAS